MVTAGIDVGHRTSKLVLLNDGAVISERVLDNSDESAVIAERVLNKGLKEVDIRQKDIDFTVATGAMGKGIAFADLYRTSMACLARGVFEIFPKARTVIDLGGETCTVFKMDSDGLILDMQANDKCAAGSSQQHGRTQIDVGKHAEGMLQPHGHLDRPDGGYLLQRT